MNSTTAGGTGEFKKPSPTVALYIRKSREDEKDKEHTLDTQRTILRHLASSKGIDDYDIYQEVDSSIKIDRPELTRMLKKINQYTHILVTHIDRLGRDIGLLDDIKKICKEHGVTIITPEQTITFKNDNEDLLFGFSSVLSDYEYRRIRYRLLRGKLDGVKHNGYYTSSDFPHGYAKDPKTRRLVINEEEAPYVRLMFEMGLKNHYFSEIAEAINKRGYKTRRGNDFTADTIREMIKNKHYLGNTYYHSKALDEKVVKEGTHPPLVSEEDFNRVQKLIEGRSPSSKPKSLGLKTCLDGLLKCPRCGYYHGIRRNRKKKGEGSERYAPMAEKCRYPRKSDDTMCKTNAYKVSIVEEVVFDKLKEKEDQIKSDLETLLGNDTSDQESVLKIKAEGIEAQIRRKRDALGKLLDLFINGHMDSKEQYLENKNALEQQLSVLESDYEKVSYELNNLDTSTVKEELTRDLEVIEEIRNSDIKDQNRLLRQLIKHIEVWRQGDSIDITIKWF